MYKTIYISLFIYYSIVYIGVEFSASFPTDTKHKSFKQTFLSKQS